MSERDRWLTPTSAAALIACPARTLTWAPPPSHECHVDDTATDVGSIAHRSVQEWIESGEWHNDPEGTQLRSRFADAARAAGADVGRVRLIGSRLRLRARGIVDALQEFGPESEPLCEIVLRDDKLKLWGRPDVVMRGAATPRVMDLKSGRKVWVNGGPTPSIRRQLLLYAHLIEHSLGVLPVRADLFSLEQGLLTFDVQAAAVSETVAEVVRTREMWENGMRTAAPTSRNCKYCRDRPRCDASWIALRDWDTPEAVEGVIHSIECAENGKVALLLGTEIGQCWVSEISTRTWSWHDARVGLAIRVLNIRPGKAWRDLEDQRNFVATEETIIYPLR